MREYPHRIIEELWYTDNSYVYDKAQRFYGLNCSYCPPHRGENSGTSGRIPRHDRYKSVRKGRCRGSIEPPSRDFEGSPDKLWVSRRPSKGERYNWSYKINGKWIQPYKLPRYVKNRDSS